MPVLSLNTSQSMAGEFSSTSSGNFRALQEFRICHAGIFQALGRCGAWWELQVHVKDPQRLFHSPTYQPQRGGQPLAKE